jgi:GNAT superfamily N-acetyltransferase
VQRLRVEPADVPGVRDHARAWFRERGLQEFEWLSARPDVTEALLAAGARPHPGEPVHGGEPAAMGIVVFTALGGVLIGGSTHPERRGRGAYRALVRARWDAAAGRGTPRLAIHAGAMSRPIAERVGFRAVARIDALADAV